MKIEKITKSQHIADRYYIDFDSGEKLKVNIAQIADYSLFTGRELNDDEMTALRRDAVSASAREKALRIVGERNMSKHDVYDKLVRKDITPDDAQNAVDWLERIGVLNDTEYAAMLVRHYAARGYGVSRIKNELYKHGIDREEWDTALSQMPEDDDKAYELLSKKLGAWEGDEKELSKAIQMLIRRGFSWDEAKSAAERLRNEIRDQ